MSERLVPDQVIPPGSPARQELGRLARDVGLMLPNIVKLLGRLVSDSRVPFRSKAIVGAVVVYLASPVDLIPDAIPVVGLLDDLLLSAYAVDHMLRTAGEDVVREHWDGPDDILRFVSDVLSSFSQLVPSSIRRWVERLGG